MKKNLHKKQKIIFFFLTVFFVSSVSIFFKPIRGEVYFGKEKEHSFLTQERFFQMINEEAITLEVKENNVLLRVNEKEGLAEILDQEVLLLHYLQKNLNYLNIQTIHLIYEDVDFGVKKQFEQQERQWRVKQTLIEEGKG